MTDQLATLLCYSPLALLACVVAALALPYVSQLGRGTLTLSVPNPFARNLVSSKRVSK